MKDYSQNREQAAILEYFKPPRWEYLTGRWLSVGENDGETLSNVRALALMGWGGVAVEPSPTAFAKLRALYTHENPAGHPNIHCVNAAITTQDGPVDFYDCGVHLHKGDTSLLSTTRREELARWKRSGEQFTKTTARGITFATLLNECGLEVAPMDQSVPDEPYYARFDFITIDAEGADYDILKQIDLTAVGCRMLCVEVNARGDGPFTEYAAQHGLKLHWQSFENRIYAR